jgi:acyl dehydratase
MAATLLKAGDLLSPVTYPPISRTQLALFAGGSSDHNPMHIDIDFAHKAGAPDVFAHGMLVMALLGRAVTTWVPREALQTFSARFVSVTDVGDALTCAGEITEVLEDRATASLTVANAAGVPRVTGQITFTRGIEA